MTRKYKVRFGKRAQESLKKIDKNSSRIIMAWIKKNLQDCEDPYNHGKPLEGPFKGQWRYRIGDYRIISHIDNEDNIILLLEIKHRKDAYKLK